MSTTCRDFGFFQLTGHGMPLALQHSILTCCKTFFSLPLSNKLELSMSNSLGQCKRGYEAIGSQKLDVKPDIKEGFYVGVETEPEDPEAGSFLKGPNLWPECLIEEKFKMPVMEYHARSLQLHEVLLGILEEGLREEGLMGKQGKDVFEQFRRDPVANLKSLHYPPNAIEGNDRGNDLIAAGAHTDFGCTTILLQQPGQEGLQVWYPETETWIPIPAQEDVLIVNVGDLLDRWTKGAYRSAVHRVANVITTDRYSVPFFIQCF